MKDGHIHTPFCPHGSTDTFEMYIEKALEIGLKEISFMEHFPLPEKFINLYPEFNMDGNVKEENFEAYIKEVNFFKEKYKDKLKINVGAEVDYIEGYENEIKFMLDKYGKYFDDSILSVHMIKVNENYYPIDYSQESFNKLVELAGSLENVYQKYYEIIKKSINSDLGIYKPTRIGHLNLIRRFSYDYKIDYNKFPVVMELLRIMRKKNYTLDYNISGERKEGCGIYIDDFLFRQILELDIKMIYGSDAHTAKDISSLKKFI
ncbi:histidinol phosphatase [Candidatus Epulonipiscioides gigas]|nr:histidinol phosphatase [Epulopiscium sp. SCG-C07WGA-EpuloA2]